MTPFLSIEYEKEEILTFLTVEKPCRHHLNQVIKVNITGAKSYGNHDLPDTW